MSEFWMFVSTVVGAGLLLLMAKLPLDRHVDEAVLRAGLWLNAVNRPGRDRIIEWRRRKTHR